MNEAGLPNRMMTDPIDAVRGRTINKILLATFLLSVITFVTNSIRDIELLKRSYEQGDIFLTLVLRGAVSVTLLGVLYFQRRHFSVQWKCVLTALAGVQIFFFFIVSFGMLASAKTMILFSPVILSLGFGFRVTLASLVLMTISYLVCGWMFDTGYLKFAFPGGVEAFILNPMSWVTYGVFMTSLAVGLMFIATTQRTALLEALTDSGNLNIKLEAEESRLVAYRDNLQQMVKEKTIELEKTNDRLNETSRTLDMHNRSQVFQQQELENILEELNTKQAKLLESGKLAAIGMLTAGMAHEINNPLNFINGAVQLMELEVAESSHSHAFHQSIQRIKDSVSRTSMLVGSLNQFGRKTDRMDEDCDVARIAANIVSILELIHPETKIEQVLHGQRAMIKGNAGKLHQAFLNLMQESIQDLMTGEQLKLILSTIDQEVKMTLEQSGLSKAFQGDIISSHGRENLRMYICHRIIKEHRGTLMVTLDDNGRKRREVRFPANS